MNGQERIKLEPYADWQEEMEGYRLRNASLGPSGEICLLLTAAVPELDDRENQANWIRPLLSAKKPIDHKVVLLREGEKSVIPITQQPLDYHSVHLFGDDQVLLVCGRARKYEDGTADQNAQIFDFQGKLIRSFCIGDGIERITATANKKIWVGYFDEGIFGSNGWDNEPIGRHGLICWSESGDTLDTYEQPNNHFIMDCSALNAVSEEEIWFSCGLWDSQLGLRRNGTTSYFGLQDLPRASAFAIHENYLLLDDRYRNSERYYLARRIGSEYHNVREIHFTDSSGNRLAPLAVDSRGSLLLIQCEKESYLVDMEAIKR